MSPKTFDTRWNLRTTQVRTAQRRRRPLVSTALPFFDSAPITSEEQVVSQWWAVQVLIVTGPASAGF